MALSGVFAGQYPRAHPLGRSSSGLGCAGPRSCLSQHFRLIWGCRGLGLFNSPIKHKKGRNRNQRDDFEGSKPKVFSEHSTVTIQVATPPINSSLALQGEKWQKHLQLFQEFFQELTARGSPDQQSLWRGLGVLRWFRRSWRGVSSRVGDTGLDFVAGPAGWAGGGWWE